MSRLKELAQSEPQRSKLQQSVDTLFGVVGRTAIKLGTSMLSTSKDAKNPKGLCARVGMLVTGFGGTLLTLTSDIH